MDKIDSQLLEAIADIHEIPEGAYNIRKNGEGFSRRSTANIEIVQKQDKPGIDIIVAPGTKNESIHIPVIITETGLEDVVYNDEDCTELSAKECSRLIRNTFCCLRCELYV